MKPYEIYIGHTRSGGRGRLMLFVGGVRTHLEVYDHRWLEDSGRTLLTLCKGYRAVHPVTALHALLIFKGVDRDGLPIWR